MDGWMEGLPTCARRQEVKKIQQSVEGQRPYIKSDLGNFDTCLQRMPVPV